MPRLHLVLVASVAFLLTLASPWSPEHAPQRENLARSPAPPPDVAAPALALYRPVLSPAPAPKGSSSKGSGALAKLAMKHAKRFARLEAAQVDLVSAKLAQLVVSADLQSLLAQVPPAPPKVVKKATAAAKKAVKKETKASKLVDKAKKKLDAVSAKIYAIDPGWFDQAPVISDGDVQVPVLIQEALAADVDGVSRDPGVATFGLPFAMSDAIEEIAGRPALAVDGASVWQFRTLDTWPDGSVRWALCDVQTSLSAGQILSGLSVVEGPGDSGGPLLGTQSKTKILLDTGPLQAIIRSDQFNLFQSVTVDGQVVVYANGLSGVIGHGLNGQLLLPGKNTTAYLEENGPARAVVRSDGTLFGPLGLGHVDFTCRITARKDSRDLEVSFTVRNASIKRPQHAVVESIQLATQVRTLGTPVVRVSDHEGTVQRPLPPVQSSAALLYQAFSAAKTSGLGAAQYLPHLPTVPGNKKVFVEEGYLLQIDGQEIHSLGQEDRYPEHAWLDLSSPAAGMTVGIQHMPYQWPAALEARGDGSVAVGLFPRQNPAPFTFVWRQHESRGAVFSFHAGQTTDPTLPTRRLDSPLTGRVADYAYYDRAGVFPYDLLTESEHEEALAMMGINHSITAGNPEFGVSRYLYKGTTGGSNNHAGIEVALGGNWLRNGTGGDYLNGLDLALYKSEWQVPRSDDFDHSDDPGAGNNQVPHSSGHFGDDEHRYREGMVLAYHLTGDERFRDALFDEAEVLADVSIWPHERSMYQTLRAISYVAEFTGSEPLRSVLRTRLGYITTPVIDINTATSGFGWEAAPGHGLRGYYVNSSDNKNEKPVGENFQARGFISASLGPLGYYHAWRALPPGDALGTSARGRMLDLSRWTRNELFPSLPDPADQRLAYSYAVTQQTTTVWENTDFHPILLGMAESWRDTNDAGYMEKGAEQLRAAAAHGDLSRWNTRLDVQHFLRAYRDYVTGQ